MNKNKKQTMIIAALGVVLLAVGAFQFVGLSQPIVIKEPVGEEGAGGETAAPVGAVAAAEPAKTLEQAEAERKMLEEQIETILAATVTPRDPFRPKGSVSVQAPGAPSAAVPEAPRVVGNGAAPPVDAPRPRRSASPSYPDLAVFDPFGAPSGPGVLPLPGAPAGGIKAPGGSPAEIPNETSCKVAGVIVGKTRMAIVEDSNGNQKLVKEGDAIDGKKTIVGIESGRVSVREDGKTKVIKLEEEKR
jgi:hypothetical protein